MIRGFYNIKKMEIIKYSDIFKIKTETNEFISIDLPISVSLKKNDLLLLSRIQLYILKKFISYKDINKDLFLTKIDFNNLFTTILNKKLNEFKEDSVQNIQKFLHSIINYINENQTSILQHFDNFHRMYSEIIFSYNEDNKEKIEYLINRINYICCNLTNLSSNDYIELCVNLQRFINIIKKPYPLYNILITLIFHLPIYCISHEIECNDNFHKKNFSINDVYSNVLFSSLSQILHETVDEDEFLKVFLAKKLNMKKEKISSHWFKMIQKNNRNEFQKLFKLNSKDDDDDKISNIIISTYEEWEKNKNFINFCKKMVTDFQFKKNDTILQWFFVSSLFIHLKKNEMVNKIWYSKEIKNFIKKCQYQNMLKKNKNITLLYIYTYIEKIFNEIKKSQLFSYNDFLNLINITTIDFSELLELFDNDYLSNNKFNTIL
ncbi:hypothetical protein LbFV_ORF83 [Leptopilina boulardi filamentous virus]|uniref:Uncharacterized protein n=1 Tax=Leptopilina boulardi filamentous virus TaxID=552509 RepID=A0A1S5YD38_9VIRU|nr:hypothetical protein LbFV_ORF83 [Leptopilina boulardi filamentous virus]AQQ80003.1 hypothetical protein LbFV_ORF83 [Leptopilina boulardi filamentous virus]